MTRDLATRFARLMVAVLAVFILAVLGWWFTTALLPLPN